MCQTCKKPKRKCSKSPVKHSLTASWHAARTDLVGLYVTETAKGGATFSCLIIADLATHWVELVEISNKMAEEVALKFDRAWLSWHLRPNYYVFDKDSEFTGQDF